MRVLTATATIIVIGLVAFTVFAVVTTGGGRADAPEITGVDRAELERQGIHLSQPQDRNPRVSAAQAVQAAGPRGTVKETVLAWMTSPRDGERDVWVISYYPQSIGDISEGPPSSGLDIQPSYTTNFALDFIDAETGTFISGISISTTE